MNKKLIFLFHIKRSRAESHCIAGIASSNPAEDMDVRPLCLLCRYRLLRRADHSFRGVLTGVCLCV